MMKKHIKICTQIALVLFVVIFMTVPSFAAVFDLRAEAATVTMPDGAIIPVWGFALGTGPVTVPGPFLVVPHGDTTLTINLTNNLPVSTSIVIPGLPGALSPDTFTDAQGRQRVNSFTYVTLPFGTNSYTWTNLKPGTYIYHSGTYINLQVHMGLYGGLKRDVATGQAYIGVLYDNEVILFYSEIDTALHDPDALPAQPLNYKPDYFLINGQPYPASAPIMDHPIVSGEQVLIRLLNMGLKTHVPSFIDRYVSVIAEDGFPYMYPKTQYSVLLPAGKTMDVLWTAPDTDGAYPVYDSSNFLRNADVSPGGMLTYLNVGPPPTTYSISGTVRTPDTNIAGSPIAGVTMTLTGAAGAATTTNALGNYTFTGLANGSYTVTPTLGGYAFTPTSRAVTVSGANVGGQNFTGIPGATPTYSISGAVSTAGGSPIAGVTMTLTGAAGAATTTNTLGNYTFFGLANGGYTVTPSLAGYTFTPTSRAVTVSGANVGGQNFTGTPGATPTYSISGAVSTAGGSPIAGVTMTLTGVAGAATTTNTLGNYTFFGLANGGYTVTPSLAGYTFTPTSRNVTVSGANVGGQNFTGTPTGGATYSISGTVVMLTSTGNVTIAGVTMTFDRCCRCYDNNERAGAVHVHRACKRQLYRDAEQGGITICPLTKECNHKRGKCNRTEFHRQIVIINRVTLCDPALKTQGWVLCMIRLLRLCTENRIYVTYSYTQAYS